LSNDGRERRKYRRIQAPVICRPAGLRVLSKHQEAVDVSRGGVRVYSDEKLAVGDRLTLELLLQDVPEEVIFQAEVAWIERLPKGAPAVYDVGLKFLNVDLAAASLLASVLGDEGP
jgi:hypothetical protein